MSLDTCALFPPDSPAADILGWTSVLRARAWWGSVHQSSSDPIDLSWPKNGLATCSTRQLSPCAVRSWILHRASRSDLCGRVDVIQDPFSVQPSTPQPQSSSVCCSSPLLALAALRWACQGSELGWSRSNSQIAVSDRSTRLRCLGISLMGSQLRIGVYLSGQYWDLCHSNPPWIVSPFQLATYWIWVRESWRQAPWWGRPEIYRRSSSFRAILCLRCCSERVSFWKAPSPSWSF